MLKKIILHIVLFVGLSINAYATVEQADSAYMADDFLKAVSLFQQAIDTLGPSAERYYNLGNSYYRLGLNGMAIVNYERALRLDPANRDINDNLNFVNSKITDRINPDKSFVDEIIDKTAMSINPNLWGWIALGAFVLTLAAIGLYIFAGAVTLRKAGFFGGIILTLCCVAANILAQRAAHNVSDRDSAVVISPSVILSTSPRQPKDRTEEAMLLHEGTKVTILDSIPGIGDDRMWYDVKVDNSHRAWISSAAVEII